MGEKKHVYTVVLSDGTRVERRSHRTYTAAVVAVGPDGADLRVWAFAATPALASKQANTFRRQVERGQYPHIARFRVAPVEVTS